jgi:hypothetical protein
MSKVKSSSNPCCVVVLDPMPYRLALIQRRKYLFHSLISFPTNSSSSCTSNLALSSSPSTVSASPSLAESVSSHFPVINDSLLLKLIVFPENHKLSDILVFEIIYEILTVYSYEMVLSKYHEIIILKLLSLFPEAAKLRRNPAGDKDGEDEEENQERPLEATVAEAKEKERDQGLLLIHYFCLMNYPNSIILARLIEIYSSSVACYGNINNLLVTPLLLLLMKGKDEYLYRLALFFVASCPASAR